MSDNNKSDNIGDGATRLPFGPSELISAIHFGHGSVGLTALVCNGLPSLLIERIEAKKVGTAIERPDPITLKPGSLILTFANQESLAVLIEELSKLQVAEGSGAAASPPNPNLAAGEKP